MEIELKEVFLNNARELKKEARLPSRLARGMCIRLISFYQNHHTKRMCPYTPTCSEYAKRAINNCGVILGVLYGGFRILRCNPFSHGKVDPAPERPFRKKWLV